MASFAQFIERGPFFIGGNIVTDYKLYHYVAGTTSLLDLWTDRAKSSTTAQPLLADANGLFSAYGDGLYKFVLKTAAETTVYTWDNVSIIDQDVIGEGAALASAATLVLGTDGNFFHVTGTTEISAISGDIHRVTLVFDGILNLAHSGNLFLNGAIDHVTEANEVKEFINDGAGVWREIAITIGQNVIDIKIKKAIPRLRLIDTTDGQEYDFAVGAGDLGLQENTGTEGSPTWTNIAYYDKSLTTWNLVGQTVLTPTITTFASATHTHLNAAGGGLLGASSVGTTQVKTTATGTTTTANFTGNVGLVHTFTVTGVRIGEFTITPSAPTDVGTCHLEPHRVALAAATTGLWKLTIDGDGTGAGSLTVTVTWDVLGTVA